MNEWRVVFWTAFVIFGLTSVIYGIWASGEMQPWNNPEKQPLEEDGDVDDKSEQNVKEKIEEKNEENDQTEDKTVIDDSKNSKLKE